jgi:predicted MFS family arabinose efflux permease
MAAPADRHKIFVSEPTHWGTNEHMTIARIFIPFALGYFLSYLYRVVNAVIAPELTADLGIGAADLGLLTSAYFLTFAAFQLPLGILLDRFGPRRTEAALLLFAALGAFLFSVADSTTDLVLARAMIGFGVSACLMGAFKAYAVWFPKEKLPLVNGFQMAAGGLGALAGTIPVEMALHVTDWRGVFAVLAGLTVLVAAAVFFVVPERDQGHGHEGLGDQIKGIVHIFTSPVFWRIAPLTVLSQAAFLSIQSLWSGPWLRDVGGFDRAGVAEGLFLIALTMVAGFIFLGSIAERLSRIGIRPVPVAVTGMSISLCAQVVLGMDWAAVPLAAWVAFAFFGTAGILPYAALSQHFPLNLAGRVNTALNLLVFVLAFTGQWGMGAIIEQWPASADGGYPMEGYRAAFLSVAALQAVALAWFFIYRRRTE